MTTSERVRALVEPVVARAGCEIYDVEHTGGAVRVLVDREGGVDLEVLAQLTRQVSRLLDEHDPLPGRYVLEVSSPGLERPLRTAAHFVRAVGSEVSVKTLPGIEGERRVRGTLAAADDEGFTVRLAEGEAGAERRLRYDEIERARTVFEWGPAPKPGGGGTRTKKRKAATP